MPLAKVAELLTDDREGYVPPVALTQAAGAPAASGKGLLLTKSTVVYIAAVIKL